MYHNNRDLGYGGNGENISFHSAIVSIILNFITDNKLFRNEKHEFSDKQNEMEEQSSKLW